MAKKFCSTAGMHFGSTRHLRIAILGKGGNGGNGRKIVRNLLQSLSAEGAELLVEKKVLEVVRPSYGEDWNSFQWK